MIRNFKTKLIQDMKQNLAELPLGDLSSLTEKVPLNHVLILLQWTENDWF